MSAEYRVQLDVFSGPLDLLLYLIRREELDIEDIAIRKVTAQYLQYCRLLDSIDPNVAGEFLVLAATLIELKSRALLPTPPIEPLEDDDDSSVQLVRQLLEYKRFKDAARALGSAADERRRRYVRIPADLPPALDGVELEDVEVWDLVRAFERVMSAIGQGAGYHEVRYDETPIESYKQVIVESLLLGAGLTFSNLFAPRSTRAEVVGLFLALLELIREQRVRAEQERIGGAIHLFALQELEEPLTAETEPADDVVAASEAQPFALPDLGGAADEHRNGEREHDDDTSK